MKVMTKGGGSIAFSFCSVFISHDALLRWNCRYIDRIVNLTDTD